MLESMTSYLSLGVRKICLKCAILFNLNIGSFMC